jgi:hypothetical protein
VCFKPNFPTRYYVVLEVLSVRGPMLSYAMPVMSSIPFGIMDLRILGCSSATSALQV